MKVWVERGQTFKLVEQERQAGDSEPKALACFGAVRDDRGDVYLYFCEGQPNSDETLAMMRGLVEVARREVKRYLIIRWDQASWHKSKRVETWVREHNRRAREEGDVRIMTWLLPTKSPWLNPMEPRWVHAKRAVAEPKGVLTKSSLRQRLCDHFRTKPLIDEFKESCVKLH